MPELLNSVSLRFTAPADATQAPERDAEHAWTGQLLEGLLVAYRREAFESGYERAVKELLDGLVFVAEEFLGRQEAAANASDLRKLVYAFGAHLERRLCSMAQHHGFVEGGLGI